jgi:hypothetical protein
MSFSTLGNLQNVGGGGVSVTPQTVASAATVNGRSIDCRLLDDFIDAVVVTGDCGDATLTLNVKLQEAIQDPAQADGNPLASDWSDIDSGNAAITALAGATAADFQQLFISSRKRSKRFVRGVVITAGGGTLSVPISVAIVGRLKITGPAPSPLTGVGAGYQP